MRARRLVPLLLVLVVACGGEAPTPTDSGIEGLVTTGPTCPVETPGADCADKPFAVELFVVDHGSQKLVARVRSAADGRFRVALRPGEYTILPATQAGPPSLAPLDVVVRAHAFTRVTVRFDSGIR